jgi:ribose transport system substrate-binding protein
VSGTRKSRIGRTAAAAAVGILGASLAACSSSSSSAAPSSSSSSTASGSSAAAAGPFTIGVMINDTTNPFLAAMGSAMTAEAKKYNMTVDILNGNTDNSTELADVQDLINKHVNALFLTPSDPVAILPGVKQANQAGIPVFDVNSAIASGGQLVTYIGDSDYQYGVDEGNMAARATSPSCSACSATRPKWTG